MSTAPRDQQPMSLVVVTAIDAEAAATVTLGLQWDLPSAVVVRHWLDVTAGTLTRTVSDASGLIEEGLVHPEHNCAECAVVGDVVPTVVRLARSRRWQSMILHLPVSVDAESLVAAIDTPSLRRIVRVGAVVAAVRGESVVEDLLGGRSLAGIGAQAAVEDERGAGEVLARLVEAADAVTWVGQTTVAASDLLDALARPGATLCADSALRGTELINGERENALADAWTSPFRSGPLPALEGSTAWRLDLASPRPCHPGRLLDRLAGLGMGRHRTRGAFWLPTRPGVPFVVEGAGSHLSIGPIRTSPPGPPRTRLVLVGSGVAPFELVVGFHECLASEEELAVRGRFWEVAADGFEPWLGSVRITA